MNSKVGAGRKVTVVGAGFSGLTSAYALARAGFQVEVLEASSRAGGLLQTRRLQQGLVETAANALLSSTAVELMFEEIGLELIGTKPEAKKRFIFKAGRARRWPLGIGASFRVFFFLLRYIISRASVAPRAQESTREWAERVLGDEASSYLVEAGLQGIYAGDPSRMSATLILGRMFRSPKGNQRSRSSASALPKNERHRESSVSAAGSPALISHQKKSPRIRGSVTAPEGMGQLIEALKTHLEKQGVVFKFNSSTALTEKPNHPHVVAVAAHACAGVIEKILPRKAAITQKIEFAPVVTSTAFFEGTDKKSDGFGILFPPRENRKVLGVLKNNFIFPNRISHDDLTLTQKFSETWIMGGALATDRVIDKNDIQIAEQILSERRECFHRQDKLAAIEITRWPKGIPQYTTNLERVMGELQGFENNVILMGNYLGEIGLAKILERALKLPEQIASHGEWTTDS